MSHINDLLKQIPHVDRLMQNDIIVKSGVYRHEAADALRHVLAELRDGIRAGTVASAPPCDALAQVAVELARRRVCKDVSRVINGTGVILHSNLGRACLSKAASEAVVEAASSYCTLEYDIENGRRGSRTGGVEHYLRELTGCEASLVVNNNAAAVLLILSAVAGGGNVLVSRGELVEIGGGFRVPDVITQCGCKLVEVGTTNKTRAADYERAVDANTKALLKVHSSNFEIVGFTESASVKQLAAVGAVHNIPVIEDIGSGALADVRRYGLRNEPFAKESLKNGADVVSFSGDKLLGGLQCGLILGRKIYIDMMKNHPLYRALRVDKMTIAALEATLRVYADPCAAQRDIPVLAMLSLSEDELKTRANGLCDEIRKQGGSAEVVQTKSVAGGGAVPGLELASYAVALHYTGDGRGANDIEKRLRFMSVPIIGRIENDRLLLDVRTIFCDDFGYVAKAAAEVTA